MPPDFVYNSNYNLDVMILCPISFSYIIISMLRKRAVARSRGSWEKKATWSLIPRAGVQTGFSLRELRGQHFGVANQC